MKNFEMGTICKEMIMECADLYGLSELHASIAVSALIRENMERFENLLCTVHDVLEEEKENK